MKLGNLGDKRNSKLKRDDKTKVNIPGHVRASMNWNKLCDTNYDKFAIRIMDGNRIIVCKLNNNSFGMKSVAYPIDDPHLPGWFKELPFDHSSMEDAIIDKKILNIVSVLDWDLTDTKTKLVMSFLVKHLKRKRNHERNISRFDETSILIVRKRYYYRNRQSNID